jgi:transposase InsO family protein
MSDLIKQVCKLLKINKLCTTPYHPEANGLVENFNGVLKKMLKMENILIRASATVSAS